METLIRLLAEASQLGWAVAVVLVGVIVGLVKVIVTIRREGNNALERNTETVVALLKERHERDREHTQELAGIHERISTVSIVLHERLPRQRP